MKNDEQELARLLVQIFDNVLLTEEKALQKGYFSDLSLAEMHALEAIGPYEARTMTETASDLGITTGTLTVSIDRLVKKGYVLRNRDVNDRRIVRISLTHNGKLAYRIHSKFHAVLARRILEPYSDEEREKFIKMISEIDVFVKSQLSRYSDESMIRKTAKEVAKSDRQKE
ncbi:MAG: MarR family transcriptional regulator [Clostridia bacterium]|nr:MarR family transcriptional regulator [Clostridia bacterium]